MLTLLPERLEAPDGLLQRRWVPDDAEALGCAVAESAEHAGRVPQGAGSRVAAGYIAGSVPAASRSVTEWRWRMEKGVRLKRP
jgi:hypothetical protein